MALRLSGKWRGACVARLGMDGAWQPLGTVEGALWRPGIQFQFMCPEFFRFGIAPEKKRE